MPASRVRHAFIAGLLAATSVSASAANMQVKTADIALGKHVSGPTLAADGLAGHVVVLEFWGINCPPCIASMPKLEELHRQCGPQGLVVIGAHAQGGGADDIRRTVNELGVTFTIVENANVNGGMDFDGIPHCMVFDHTGKCVFRGSPGDAHDVVVAAVQAAPAAILATRALVKLAPLAQTLKNEALCGSVLRKARPLVDSSDADTADEARFVVERVEEYGRKMLEEARNRAKPDPIAAATLAQRCATAFKGTDIGTEATKQLQGWRKDKSFQAAIKAGNQLAQLEALRAAAANLPGGPPPRVVGQAREIARAIEKGAPGSEAAAKAAEIVAGFDAGGAGDK